MKEEAAVRAASLLHRCRAATLGVLHDGAPGLSMVPYAIHPDPFALIILVSALAAHTQDMDREPRVGLLVMDPERDDTPAHTLARVAIEATVQRLAADDARYATARAAYTARFPDMTMLFELGDFALFALEPVAVRAVLGFASAHSLTPETLARAVRAGA
ncbi:MAG: pyridoxamine 5'-phosphate oxidase family protein [Betaproteobacteria bacterium]